MNITISGASGLIGRGLLKVLGESGHQLHVLSRQAGTNLPAGMKLSVWDPEKGPPPRQCLEGADAVVHLAGEPVAQRWTAAAKQRIRESRVVGTRHLVEALSAAPHRPVLVCASAIGYYGSRGQEILDESAPAGSGYLAEICVAWEREALAAEALGLRVAMIRVGMVLGRGGGALQRMLLPFRLGVGGRLGAGTQWMSWIHLADLLSMFRFVLEKPLRGPFNGVSPQPVRNREFTRALARVLHRPAIFPVPTLALRALFGEMAGVLLESQRVTPRAAEAAGFRFRFPELGPALTDLLE